MRGVFATSLLLLTLKAIDSFAVTGASSLGTSPLPALSANDLWVSLRGECDHLSGRERLLLRSTLDVLLAKVSLAERAERVPLTSLRPRVPIEYVLPERSQTAEALQILSAVRTARDMLARKLDVATVAAIMLSQALTARAPSWPHNDYLPIAFKVEVSSLQLQSQQIFQVIRGGEPLEQQRIERQQPEPQQQQQQQQQGQRLDNATLDTHRQGRLQSEGLLQKHLEAEAKLRRIDESATAVDETAASRGRLRGDDFLPGETYRGRRALLGPASVPELAADARNALVLLGSALVGLRSSDALPVAEQHSRALQAIQVHAPLASSLGVGGAFSDLEELSYSRLFPESLRSLRVWYTQMWPDSQSLMPHLRDMLEQNLRLAPSLLGLVDNLSVTGRVKTVTSTFRKLLRDDRAGGRGIEDIRDIAALRVVLQPAHGAAKQLAAEMNRSEALTFDEIEGLVCFGAYRELRHVWNEEPGRFKDFVTLPKPNGYQSLHTNLQLPDGRIFEVQIRTASMHDRAESGSAAHNTYRAAQLGAAELGAAESLRLLPPSKPLQEEVPRLLPPSKEAAQEPLELLPEGEAQAAIQCK
jgi:hypothetical protein